MEEQLREHLMEDEQLLWVGTPESFETLDKTNKTSIIVGTTIKVVVTLFLFFCFTYGQDKGDVKPGIIAVILVFAVLALINPFVIARRLRKKTLYGLTDKRVMRTGTFDEAIPYDRIKTAVLRTDRDGHTSLLCGSRAVNLKPRQWRGEADASFINSNDDSEAARVILFALPIDSKLKALLEKYLPIS